MKTRLRRGCTSAPMRHHTRAPLLRNRVKVCLVGVGGNGSQALTALARLDRAIRALGHPGGLDCVAFDPDRVSEANVGRQLFYEADIGKYKCDVLVHRVNQAFGLAWRACPEPFDSAREGSRCTLLIGCVDNAAARRALQVASQESDVVYWLDMGNRTSDGQVILGEAKRRYEKDWYCRLPTAPELYPSLLEAGAGDGDAGPSCGLAEALERQALFINQAVVTHAMQMLWQLFREGGLDYSAVFVDLARQQVRTLPVDREAWRRFGVRRPRRPPARHPADDTRRTV